MNTRTAGKPRVVLTGVMVAACLLPTAELALATTTTTTFTVQITLVNTCTINSASTLNFGNSIGVLTTAVPGSSTLDVTCTSGAPYFIALDKGLGTGATLAARKMTFSGNTVTYSLYTDASHSTLWGDVHSSNDVSASGTGTNQTFTVYGLVPVQTTPPAGTYTDTITVTVTY